jgi:hypothetical protein
VIEYYVLYGIIGLKRNKVTDVWKKLRFEELHIWYSSIIIIMMIK